MPKELMFDPDDYSVEGEVNYNYDHDDYTMSDPGFRYREFEDRSVREPNVDLDVPYVPTDEDVVHAMLKLAGVTSNDILYDLGCGDGRIVVSAALERHARGVGIDMDPERIAEAQEYAGHAGVEHLVDFYEGDLLDSEFSEATVVTLYLLDIVNMQLRPRLLDELRPGTRIVSHAFDMGDWMPDERVDCDGVNVFKWIVPAKVAGRWEWTAAGGEAYRVELEQKHQRVGGKAWVDGEEVQLERAMLRGDLLELVFKKDADDHPVVFVMRHAGRKLIVVAGGSETSS